MMERTLSLKLLNESDKILHAFPENWEKLFKVSLEHTLAVQIVETEVISTRPMWETKFLS